MADSNRCQAKGYVGEKQELPPSINQGNDQTAKMNKLQAKEHPYTQLPVTWVQDLVNMTS